MQQKEIGGQKKAKKLTKAQLEEAVARLESNLGILLSGLQNLQKNLNQSTEALGRRLSMAEKISMGLLEVSSEPLQQGDSAVISHLGRLKKEDGSLETAPFQGGTSETTVINSLLSGELVEGFEAALVGKSVGDEVSVDITFPESYGNKQLASKQANFLVKVQGIYRASENSKFLSAELGKIVEQMNKENAQKVAQEASAEA